MFRNIVTLSLKSDAKLRTSAETSKKKSEKSAFFSLLGAILLKNGPKWAVFCKVCYSFRYLFNWSFNGGKSSVMTDQSTSLLIW